MRSATVPLFIAASLGALTGLVTALPLWPLVALALVALVTALLSRAPIGRALAIASLAFTLAAGAGAFQRDRARAREAAIITASNKEDVVVAGVVGDVSFGQSGARHLVVDVDGVLPDRAVGATVSVAVPARVRDDIEPGDRVRVRGSPRPLQPAFSPGVLDEQRMGLARGIDAEMLARDIAVVVPGEKGAPFARARLRLREKMSALLPPRMAGLELALLVGDTSLLDDEQRDIYRRAGAGHLLAVSGLQVSLLALLTRRFALVLLHATSFGRRAAAGWLPGVVALVVVWSFVLLCGLPPSAVRAGAMASAVVVAPLLGRRARALDALGIAGLGTVLVSPASVLDPSFLLSYGAVLGLAATASPVVSASGSSLRRFLVATVIASVGAGVVTLPLSAYLFGTVAPAGLVANIVLVPAATFLQVPALALGLLGALLHVEWIAWLGAEAALVLEALTAGLGDLLPAVRSVDAPGGVVTLLLLAAAAAFAFALAQRRAVVGGVAVAVAVASLAIAHHEPGDSVRIAVLPVGQGDGSVFEFPDGAVMVVDGGGDYGGREDPGNDVVLPYLRRRGIARIDLMVLSHPHPDHALGLAAVAAAVPVDRVWTNGSGAPLELLLIDAARAKNPAVIVEHTPQILGAALHDFHGAQLAVLAPAPAEKTSTYPELEDNDNSLVLRVCNGADCVLWPGDVEALGEDLLLHTGASIAAQVVKAPHHGSKSSSTDAFVAATGARDVIFCTGVDNSFGFPHQPVVERWQKSGAHLWDTAKDGEIHITLTGRGVRIRSFVLAEH